MPQLNLEAFRKTSEEKIRNAKTENERRAVSKLTYDLATAADSSIVQSILSSSGVLMLMQRAGSAVNHFVDKNNATIYAEHRFRQIALVTEEEGRELFGSFFDVYEMAGRMATGLMERSLIEGFFMNKDRMTLIQAYHLVSPEIMGIIYGKD